MTSHRFKFTVFRTNGHWRLVQSDSRRVVGVSVLRNHITRDALPIFRKNVQQPTRGILRDGLRAFTIDRDGRQVIDEEEMRISLGIEPLSAVVPNLVQSSRAEVIGFSSLGNGALNSEYVIYYQGELVYRDDERERLQDGPPYFCFVVLKDGTLFASLCHFKPDGSGRWKIEIDGRDASEAVHLAISGPALVQNRRVVNPYDNPWAASQYSDIRHLICGPYPYLTDLASGEQVLDEKGRPKAGDYCMDDLVADPAKRGAAIRGDIVEVGPAMRDVDGRVCVASEGALRKALHDKNYEPVSSIEELRECGERGRYWLDPRSGVLNLIYRMSPYPHSFLALRDEEPGVLYSFAVSGWSNNGGSDPLAIANDLVAGDFSEAILGDNGYDVSHYIISRVRGGPAALLPVHPAFRGRERVAGLLAHVAGAAGPSHFRHSLSIPEDQSKSREVVEVTI